MQRGDTVVGKYRLLRRLGAGGMGVVWEATHLLTGRPFAIKFLLSPGHDEHASRFLLEAKVSGLVRHPNIVDVYDVGTWSEQRDTPFLVMDLLDGLSLSEVLRTTPRLTLRQAFGAMMPILSGILAAHEAGVVHRDLKPSNLFLHRTPTGAVVPKILDFGISKLVGPAREAASDGDRGHPLTRTGTVLGSPLYMSPEQVRGESTLDARSDLHALGAVLWECLVGETLFSGKLDDRELAAQIANAPRPRLEEKWPECPASLAGVVDRCIALRKEDRFASAREVRSELDGIRGELGIAASLDDPAAAREVFPGSPIHTPESTSRSRASSGRRRSTRSSPRSRALLRATTPGPPTTRDPSPRGERRNSRPGRARERIDAGSPCSRRPRSGAWSSPWRCGSRRRAILRARPRAPPPRSRRPSPLRPP